MHNLNYNMLLLTFVLFIGNSLADFPEGDNINRFLFEIQNFQFIDLSQSTHREAEKDAFTEDYRNLSHTCLNQRLGTEIHVMSGYVTFKKEIIIRDLQLKKLILPLYFGDTNQPCLMVFKFGWSKYFKDRQKYCGSVDESQNLSFPGISEEVANWITTAYKNIVGVGVDLPAVDPGHSITFAAFETLTNAGVYVLTNIKLDNYIPGASCTALVLPPKIVGLGSSPLRLVAVCPISKMKEPSKVFLP